MRLSSVRDLKAQLSEELVPAIKRLAFAAQDTGPFHDAVESPRLALGISRRGKKDYVLAVRFQSEAVEGHPFVQQLIAKAHDEVDLRYVGRIHKRSAAVWYRAKQRPLLIGCSVGHHQVTAGTLGCFVQKRGGGPLSILSNNHVLANENRAQKGDAILQPGRLDGGKLPGSRIASLAGSKRLAKHTPNAVDCAYAVLANGIDGDVSLLTGIGQLAGVGTPISFEDSKVSKVGRTTGESHGRVTAFELDYVAVEFDVGDLTFNNQIEIEGEGLHAFSDGGDSGSLIFDEELRAVGLLFAGSATGGSNGRGLTYANPIQEVLDTLKLEIVF